MTHHSKEQILDRFRESDRFTLDLAPDDTAWDPETGDTLIGGVIVHFFRGTFPGTPYCARIEH